MRLGETAAIPVAVIVVLACAPIARGAEPPVELPAGAGRDVLERACTQCHAIETVIRQRRGRSQWEAKIDSMIAKGAKLTDEDIELIADYLAKHFGPDDAP